MIRCNAFVTLQFLIHYPHVGIYATVSKQRGKRFNILRQHPFMHFEIARIYYSALFSFAFEITQRSNYK